MDRDDVEEADASVTPTSPHSELALRGPPPTRGPRTVEGSWHPRCRPSCCSLPRGSPWRGLTFRSARSSPKRARRGVGRMDRHGGSLAGEPTMTAIRARSNGKQAAGDRQNGPGRASHRVAGRRVVHRHHHVVVVRSGEPWQLRTRPKPLTPDEVARLRGCSPGRTTTSAVDRTGAGAAPGCSPLVGHGGSAARRHRHRPGPRRPDRHHRRHRYRPDRRLRRRAPPDPADESAADPEPESFQPRTVASDVSSECRANGCFSAGSAVGQPPPRSPRRAAMPERCRR